MKCWLEADISERCKEQQKHINNQRNVSGVIITCMINIGKPNTNQYGQMICWIANDSCNIAAIYKQTGGTRAENYG